MITTVLSLMTMECSTNRLPRSTTRRATPVRVKQVCHTVVDNTMTYAVNCAAMASTEYVCPKNGEPCYGFYKIEPAFMNCGRVTKEVCGPPEMFHDEDPRTQVNE